jgi:hypothetical protein
MKRITNFIFLCESLWLSLRAVWLNYFLPQSTRRQTQSFTKYTLPVFILLLVSCEKNVTVEVPKSEEQIVVEGRIEIGQFAQVLLSRTVPFFGEINVNDILLNTLQGATVIVNDGTTIDTLVQFPGFGLYTSPVIQGVAGKTYSLTVIAEGKTLTAVTTIPYPVQLDSVWWKVDGNRDSLGFAWAHLTDPDTIGNCYQWKAQRINHYTYGDDIGKMKDSTFIAAPGSVFEDKFINDKSFDFSFPRGHFQFTDKEDDQNDEQFFFKRGDTIVVQFLSIDRANFEFWRTEESQVQSNGNPFGSPAPVTSNIVGGLGTWGGFAPTLDTIIAR